MFDWKIKRAGSFLTIDIQGSEIELRLCDKPPTRADILGACQSYQDWTSSHMIFEYTRDPTSWAKYIQYNPTMVCACKLDDQLLAPQGHYCDRELDWLTLTMASMPQPWEKRIVILDPVLGFVEAPVERLNAVIGIRLVEETARGYYLVSYATIYRIKDSNKLENARWLYSLLNFILRKGRGCRDCALGCYTRFLVVGFVGGAVGSAYLLHNWFSNQQLFMNFYNFLETPLEAARIYDFLVPTREVFLDWGNLMLPAKSFQISVRDVGNMELAKRMLVEDVSRFFVQGGDV